MFLLLAADVAGFKVLAAPAIQLSNLTVPETFPGRTVGTLSVTEGPAGATYTFTFDNAQTPHAHSQFEIVGATLKLKQGVTLDFEDGSNTHTVWITATGGEITIPVRRFDVQETNENERPTIVPQALQIAENTTGVSTVQVAASDPDSGTVLNFSVDSVTATKRNPTAPDDFGPSELLTFFTINPSGFVVINQDAILDYESTELFTLTVRVHDGIEGTPGTLSSQPATITLRLQDVWNFNPQTRIEVRSSTERSWTLLPEPSSEPGAFDARSFTITDFNSPFSMSTTEPGVLLLDDFNEANFTFQDQSVGIRVTDTASPSESQNITVTLTFAPVGENSPNGTPLLKQLFGNPASSDLRPVRVMASAPDGTIYVAGVELSGTDTNGVITVFANDPEKGSMTQLPGRVQIAKDFIPTTMAVAGGWLYVGGNHSASATKKEGKNDITVGVPRRHLYALPLENLTSVSARKFRALDENGSNIEQQGVISDLKVATVQRNGVAALTLYVCGNFGAERHNYFAELDADLTPVSNKEWYWTGYSRPDNASSLEMSVANGETTALAVDQNGNVYAAGYWENPLGRGDSTGQNIATRIFEPNTFPVYPEFRLRFRFYSDFIGSDGRKARCAYLVKFTREGNTWTPAAYNQDYRERTISYVRGLQIVSVGGSERLYVLQEFMGEGGLGGQYVGNDLTGRTPSFGFIENRELNTDIKLNRFDLSLNPVFPQNALIQGSGNEEVKSFTTDPAGNIYLAGIARGATTVRFLNGSSSPATAPNGGYADPLTPGNDLFFAVKLSPSFTWQWDNVKVFEGSYAPDLALISWYPTASGVLVGGNIKRGLLTVEKDDEVNHISAESGKNAGFLTLLGGSDGEPVGRIFLEIESRFGRSQIEVLPWLGSRAAEIDKTYTVTVPEIIYLDSQQRVLPQTASVEQIETEAVTRATCTGYTVADTPITGTSTNFTFTFTGSMKITFHWKVEHALVVANDLRGTGSSFTPPNVPSGVLDRLRFNERANWQKGGASQDAGSVNPGLGNPSPAAEKHWVLEGTRKQAVIDGIAPDFGRPGYRYIVTGYHMSSLADGGRTESWDAESSRQQTDEFYMSEAQAVTWLWAVQIRVQATTTSDRTKSFPRIVAGPANARLCYPGSDERWFLKDSSVIMGALESGSVGNGNSKTLSGWVSAVGLITPASGALADLTGNLQCGTETIRGREISLTEPTSVVWNYETTVYEESVSIGNAAQFNGTSGQNVFPKSSVTENGSASGLVRRPRSIRLGQGPPGSTDANMQVWDEVAHLSYPTRPGVYFLEWHDTGPDPIILRINSDWGTRHYRHLAHDDMPAVNLDPDPSDVLWFVDIPYSESDGQVSNNAFTARSPGRHVLVFLKSPDPLRPATGDTTRETNLVRQVETRAWDEGADPSSSSNASDPKGRWGDATKPMVVGQASAETARDVEIGRKVTSSGASGFDRAALESGFIVHPNARYNPNIYDRTSVTNAGPIIPVNMEFTTIETNKLVVVWYEHSENADIEPGNLFWPYQSEKVKPVWPTNSYLTVIRRANDQDSFDQPLDRIVIASRLGSEGRNWNYAVQRTFSLDRFDQVGIYQQPNRDLPGYNPNEEHAVIAPSFKLLHLPTPPPTAFALRNDLNVSRGRIESEPQLSLAEDYTSDPYVLVQYFDKSENEFKMNVYAVEKEDHSPELNPNRYPEMEANFSDLAPIRSEIEGAGLTLQTPLNWVIGDYANRNEIAAAATAAAADLAAHAGLPPALAAKAIADFMASRDPDAEQANERLIAELEDQLILAERQNAETWQNKFDETVRAFRRAADRLAGVQRKFPYTFRYEMRAGEPVQPPYPLPLVIGLTPCLSTSGQNPPDQRVYWEDHKGGPWAVSQGTFSGRIYYPLLTTFWGGEGPNAFSVGECVPFITTGEQILAGRTADPVFAVGSSFTVRVNGAAVTVSLGGADTAAFVTAVQAAVPSIVVTRLISGQILLQSKFPIGWALADGSGEPLKAAGFLPFANALFTVDEFVDPAGLIAELQSEDAFSQTLWAALSSAKKAVLVDLSLTDDQKRAALAGAFNELLHNGIPSGGRQELEGEYAAFLARNAEGISTVVTYDTKWPDVLPILKAGETLTYAGGEYKADHPGPEQPGLPGVIGWAVGRIIYDELNPNMANDRAFDFYTAQLISPLEERIVRLKADLGLSDTEIQEFRDAIQPAKGLTKAVGVRWQFPDLPPSLAKRVFFDPFSNALGIKGYLNDKTLGDSTLTAAPPPIYVLEPDILTRRERDLMVESPKLEKLRALAAWQSAVPALYALCRNPLRLSRTFQDPDPYYPGLELDVETDEGGADLRDDSDNLVTIPFTARPRNALGPGLALVPNSRFLDPAGGAPEVSYVTLVENDNEELGGPISVHIVKVEKKHRYRGAIKTILSDNVFDEKITLRHTGDFGANGDEIVYQWFYREENGVPAPLPQPGEGSWQLFADQSANSIKGLGMHQISLDGSGGLLLADNLFFVRYRHMRDIPSRNAELQNSDNWGASRLADDDGNPVPAFDPDVPADFGTDWNRHGAPFRDPLFRENGKLVPTNPLRFGGQWAGAANSPTVNLEYRPQLVMGWIKRVLDRVNPYEARFNDFRNNESPATYASMIQQAGQPYVGPVALNPDKNVVENVGLIELYQTILDRGINLSIGLSSPLSTPGINNALLLAMTRISDLYMVLGNEAYMDALDPTIGFGSSSVEYGSLAPAVFSFQNQLPSLLAEELGLLRGIDDDRRRPMHNRLFWNFTKGEGEVAYAMNYNISDVNQDGFVDESDALVQYPQGHGDAWGHYLTALKTRYRLLRHPFFNWQPRSEFYNLLDVVIDVDFLDERKFAEVAAAKAQAGTEIVNDTYRALYVEDPDGQWQGYNDPVPGRDWGVADWARRAGQGALFDWMTAMALIPAEETDPAKSGIRKVDRNTIPELAKIAANLGSVQNTYDNANGGLNPLGLDSEVVPFDIDPTFIDVGSTAQIGRRAVQGLTHFEQIFERAFAATRNALVAFDHANENKHRLRQVADNVEEFRQDVIGQDTDYRNRLIEIFGSPYAGTIGTGKPYPAGYRGPDLNLYMYVDVRGVTPDTVGSSRVDLQACKLEYSIVSPK